MPVIIRRKSEATSNIAEQVLIPSIVKAILTEDITASTIAVIPPAIPVAAEVSPQNTFSIKTEKEFIDTPHSNHSPRGRYYLSRGKVTYVKPDVESPKKESKVTIDKMLPRIYTDFKSTPEISKIEIPTSVSTNENDINSPKQFKKFKGTQPKSYKSNGYRKHGYTSNIPHNRDYQIDDGLEALDNIKCLDCKDSKKVVVYDICDFCLGKGCKKCNNTGDVKNYIPCQACSPNKFKFK